MKSIPRQHVERADRVYRTSTDAAASLAVTARSFSRMFRRLGMALEHEGAAVASLQRVLESG